MEDDTTVLNIREFDPDTMPLSCTWVIIAPPETGKTSMIENLLYARRHVYPVGKFFIGVADDYQKFCKIAGPLFVSNRWDEEEVKRHISRQQTQRLEHKKDSPQTLSVLVLDDIGDRQVYGSKLVASLFQKGSQHWGELVLIGSQYAFDFGTQVRGSVSYVAIGAVSDPDELSKLYRNFGGICGTLDEFKQILKQVTGDHTFLIIQKRSQSSEREDRLFYFKTKRLKKWKFGCREAWQWQAERYNKDFSENFL